MTGDCCLVSVAMNVEKQIKCEKVHRHILPPRKFGVGMCFEQRNRAFSVRQVAECHGNWTGVCL